MSSLLVFVVIGLFGLAIYLATGRRRRIVLACAASLLLAGIVLLVVRTIAGEAFVRALTENEVTIEPITAVWGIGTELLVDIATVLIAYGAVALVGAWLAGPGRLATAIRRALAPTFRDRPVVVHVAAVLLLLLALLWAPTGSTREVAGTLVLAGIVLLGVETLRRKSIRDFPDAQRGEGLFGRVADRLESSPGAKGD